MVYINRQNLASPVLPPRYLIIFHISELEVSSPSENTSRASVLAVAMEMTNSPHG